MLIYREEYYLSRSEPDPGTPEYTEWLQNKINVITLLK
ncbi:replicative DNA helicase domain protein [Orientia tsutsugamushi str. UT76]|nr:replicative DNA helicase domain protein [Orientia tsutsugamushi str. UT76]